MRFRMSRANGRTTNRVRIVKLATTIHLGERELSDLLNADRRGTKVNHASPLPDSSERGDIYLLRGRYQITPRDTEDVGRELATFAPGAGSGSFLLTARLTPELDA